MHITKYYTIILCEEIIQTRESVVENLMRDNF